jgi:hypothetical protein
LRLAFLVAVVLLLSSSGAVLASSHRPQTDPCDAYSDCVSSSISYLRSNPDDSLYLGDEFVMALQITPGRGGAACGSGCSESWSGSLSGVSWSYDESALNANTSDASSSFIVVANGTNGYLISAAVTFVVSITVCTTGSNGVTTCSHASAVSTVTVSEEVHVRALVLAVQTHLVNVTDGASGLVLRNPDGTFYRNDSFCVGWNASFEFSAVRTDIKINVTSLTPPSLSVRNYTSVPLGRTGSFCYDVRTDAEYDPHNATLAVRALDWQGVSMGLKESSQPFVVVRYDPQFTSYAYMMYRNSTAPSSLERPWVLLVRYDGNLPGYSYAGDNNTRPFNGSSNLAERAYFDDFRLSTMSYQPFTSGSGAFGFHSLNSTGTLEYNWLDMKGSAPLYYGNRIEKYVFNVTAPSLAPVLSEGYVYQNVTMVGCWQHESLCDLDQNYWLVPFLWNGRLSIISVDSNGNEIPSTPISLTIHNPAPLDTSLTRNFERVFGDDPQALRSFEADLYPTNETMTIGGEGRVSVILNQTSLDPPLISITAGGASVSGDFTFTPVLINGTIASVPNSLNGTTLNSNATIPIWAYNMFHGSLAYLPIATTIGNPSTFMELVNSSVWTAGNVTTPQTPSSFASQQYGFWPMGENLTLYVNTEGGGVNLLGTQKLGPDEYQATFYIEPWSGGISSVQLVVGNETLAPQSTLNASAYPSPLPPALTGFYSVVFPSTGQDTKVVFTNVWGATTTLNLGAAAALSPLVNLIPVTTATAFGVALILWLIVSGVLRTRRAIFHE